MSWSLAGKYSTFVALVFSFSVPSHAQSVPIVLTSPDQRLVMQFTTVRGKDATGPGGKLSYSVAFRGKPVLDQSALGLELEGQPVLGNDVQIVESTPGKGSDDYTLLASKSSDVKDSFNSLRLRAVESNAPGRTLVIEARAYNDGIAFRYVLPEQEAIKSLTLKQEDTEFRISTDATTWALALPNYRSSYESEYVKLPITAFSNQGGVSSNFLIGLPMLLHSPGTAWMALAEADLEGNSGMYITNPSGNWAGHYFVSKLSPRFDDAGVAIKSTLPHHSAWRVLMVADEPGRLMESNLLTDLNPSNRVQDTSWIHPGKASWNWWAGDVGSDGKAAYTTKNMEYYVDFAANSGFPYMLLDAGWADGRDITKLRGNVDVPELVRYAASKHVKVWIWLYSTSVMDQMKQAFPLFESWGVAGVKIDFINRDDQDGIKFYYDVAREAADHHLMVDFHGASKPWGIERTYPNVLSYEAVLGAENSKVARRDSPVDRTVFPFTRMVAGPLDYTPGGFNNVTEDEFIGRDISPMIMGTRAQQLALYVVFQTPFQMVSDSPQAYADQPAFQFIKDVPTAWDAMHVLNGEPGEFVTIARSHGKEWFLGSITNWTSRELHVPLNFLGTGRYTAEIYQDASDAGTNPKNVTIKKQSVRSGETLTLHLAAGGGCAIRFVPEDAN
ncbi:glycoside hydrolase family 97 protein [Granulicella sp. WH15]|uniref:glycoside hydrolase family 97 protein n=1 Tax=Granulicella sp. WH15 TaxID=2602070 RepID=UPI001366CEC5|nr:glycoside hydrolase family 97 protein [Granulicella sp. WH15]QHN03599.1 glycoside hydrolase family 97 protein [Granulicella sp. WH15]